MNDSTSALSSQPEARLRRFWRTHRDRVLVLWGAGVLASLAVTGLSALGYLEPLQARTVDVLQGLGAQRFPDEVVIVAIDDAAFGALGRRQPIPRQYLARLIRGIQRSGASVVGLDVSLNVATTVPDDGALAQAILEFSSGGASRVVLVEGEPPDAGPLADPAFRRRVVSGSDGVPIDPDGVIRRAAFVVPRPDGGPVPALGLAVLAHLGGTDPQALVEKASRAPDGMVSLPVWQPAGSWDVAGPALRVRTGELWRINFVGPQKSFLTIPGDAVARLGDAGATVAAENPLRGRIVLVGATFREGRDFFQTPHGRLPGVEVHANLAHMLASRRLIKPAGWLASFGVQVSAVLAAGVIMALLGPLAGTVAALALTLAVGLPASYLAFHGGGYAVDFVLPVVVTCMLGVTAQGVARRRLRDSLGRYVGRDVLAEIMAESPALSGERREVSVLVSDIRGFTTLSEKLPAERVAAQLNDYFPAMVGAIFAHRGTVDDFIGDGILAVFGAPLSDQDHARHAAQAAVAMQRGLEALNHGWEARGLPTLRMGIGIHTGVVFAGNVGSPERVKYTVIGDVVNVTARLEGVNKELGTTLLLTEEARVAIGDGVETRYRGEVPVKGRAEPLRVYELTGLHAADGPGKGEGQ